MATTPEGRAIRRTPPVSAQRRTVAELTRKRRWSSSSRLVLTCGRGLGRFVAFRLEKVGAADTEALVFYDILTWGEAPLKRPGGGVEAVLARAAPAGGLRRLWGDLGRKAGSLRGGFGNENGAQGRRIAQNERRAHRCTPRNTSAEGTRVLPRLSSAHVLPCNSACPRGPLVADRAQRFTRAFRAAHLLDRPPSTSRFDLPSGLQLAFGVP